MVIGENMPKVLCGG